ncbi:hypothetical protein FRC08_008787, partial [Ceratobasidium sp. 394]
LTHPTETRSANSGLPSVLARTSTISFHPSPRSTARWARRALGGSVAALKPLSRKTASPSPKTQSPKKALPSRSTTTRLGGRAYDKPT